VAALTSWTHCVALRASAEIVDYAERPAEKLAGRARATVFARGRAGAAAYEVEAALWRPVPGGSGALLIDTEPEPREPPAAPPALPEFARRRGMAVVFVALDKLPETVRAQALHDLAAHWRKSGGYSRILAVGAGRLADLLASAADGKAVDGLLLYRGTAASPAAPGGPRAIEIFGADAYWGRPPAPPRVETPDGPARRRFYLAGLGAPAVAAEAAHCAAPPNPRTAAPAMRALLAALDEWIAKGIAPPASRAPRQGGGGLVPARNLRWPTVPGLPAPPRDARLVPPIDADGNETAGLRLPDQALPLGTLTGWNGVKDKAGPACPFGASLPFAATKAEREKSGDPRLSLVERYGSRAYFVATMRVVADRLVKERLLLKEDADAYVAAAKGAPF
jgi:hypothetical protein